VTAERLAEFAGNVLVMTAMAALTYAMIAHDGELERLPD
jgi:hypothetical protein